MIDDNKEAILDVAAALMTPEDLREISEVVRRENAAHLEWTRACRETEKVRSDVLKRIMDRVPVSAIEAIRSK